MATTIVSRAVKGTPLSVTEHDANHQNPANTADIALTTANAAQASASAAQTAANAAQSTANSKAAVSDLKTVGGQSLQGPGDIALPAGGTGGSVAPVLVPWSTAIPLDTPGPGKYMARKDISAATVLTVAPSQVHDGNCNINVRGVSGSPGLAFSGMAAGNAYAFDPTPGRENKYSIVWDITSGVAGTAYYFGMAGQFADTGAPLPSGAPHVEDASRNIVRQLFSEALVTNGIVAGDCTVSGHTVSSVAIAGSELQLTVTPNFAVAEAQTLSVAANKLKDAAGNLCAAISGVGITNNLVLPLGNAADTFDRGVVTADIANPASDGGTWVGDTGGVSINANALVKGASGFASLVFRNLGSGNGYVQAVFHQGATPGFQSMQFRSDGNPAGNCLLLYVRGNDDGGLVLVKFTAGVDDSTLAITDPTPGFNTGDTVVVRIDFSGTAVVVKVNGVTRISTTVAAYVAQTYVGLGMTLSGSLGTYWDSFIASNTASLATTAADTFDRSVANPMSTTASDGGVWTGAVSNCLITSTGTLNANLGGAWPIYRQLGSGDGFVQADIAVNTAVYCGLTFRSLGDGQNEMRVYCLPTGVFVASTTAGTDTNVDSAALSLTPLTMHTFRVEFNGSTIVVKVDGTPVLTTASSDKLTQNKVGCYVYGFGGGAEFDNFTAQG